MALMKLAQGKECLDALAPRLADADEDARGEGDRGLAREPDGVEAECGVLVGRAEMRPAAPAEPLGTRFQHQALRDRDGAEGRDLLGVEHARVGVRQEAGLREDEPRALDEIGVGTRVPEGCELRARDRVAQLGLVAEGEERLLAAGRSTCAGDREHLLARQIGALAPARCCRKRAIMADVAAEPRERDEHLARIGDAAAVCLIPERRRRRHECRQRLALGEG